MLFAIDGIEFGGGERVFAQLINRLPADAFEIFLISKDNPEFYRAITNRDARLIPFDFSSRANPVVFFRIAEIIRRHGIRIVNGQGGRVEFYCRIAARLAAGGMSGGPNERVKYVSTLAMPVEGYNVSAPVGRIYAFFDRISEQYVDRFVVVSDTLKKTLLQGHRIPSEKIIRIYNGIEVEHFDPEKTGPARKRLSEEFGLDESAPLIGGIGRMVWQKGFEHLVRAMPEVLRAHPQTHLILIGDGPLRSEMKAIVRELHLQDCVLFTGFRSDIRELLACIDVLAVPSLLEGFPMVTLEAMAMAKPIVATDIDGLREQFAPEETGLLVPPKDSQTLATAINRFLEHPAFAARIGANARSSVAREFPIDKTVAETIEVYRTLLKDET